MKQNLPSKAAERVLRVVCAPHVATGSFEVARIDAKEFCDELIELLKGGYISLGGTLQDATIEPTKLGLDLVRLRILGVST
jgi:hypothetical protein